MGYPFDRRGNGLFAAAAAQIHEPGTTRFRRGVPTGGQRDDSFDHQWDAIVDIEGGTGPRGEFLTSPRGAVGPAQLMPGTAREAAGLANQPWDERRYRSDPDYNIALGRAYYREQLRVFRDPVMAAAACNAGPGRLRRALRDAQRQGGSWVDYLPAQTRNYVRNFRARIDRSAE